MKEIIIYSTTVCPYCIKAKKLLDKKCKKYKEILIDQEVGKREEMMARSERKTVPQIFIGDVHVGGCDDLYALDEQGKLDPLF